MPQHSGRMRSWEKCICYVRRCCQNDGIPSSKTCALMIIRKGTNRKCVPDPKYVLQCHVFTMKSLVLGSCRNLNFIAGLVMLLLITLMLVHHPVRIDSLQFLSLILLSVVGGLSFSKLLEKEQIQVSVCDVAWFCFLLWSLISVFWSTNRSLTLGATSIWVGYCLLYFVIRNCADRSILQTLLF